jgi:hypothetical protein
VTRVIVTVADDHDLSTVVGALRGAGLTVAEVLDEIRVVIGTVDRAAGMAALSTVTGVVDVEPEQEIQLPPPDSPVQ